MQQTQVLKFRERKQDDGSVTKRADIEFVVEVPSPPELVELVKDETFGAFVTNLINDYVLDVARELAKDNAELTNDTFKHKAFDSVQGLVEHYNTPGEGRGRRAIGEDIWNAFLDDYASIMPELIGRTPEIITQHVLILKNKFAPIKEHKNKLELFQANLAVYAENSSLIELTSPVVELLSTKSDALLEALDTKTLAYSAL
jgi:hypothetical protein